MEYVLYPGFAVKYFVSFLILQYARWRSCSFYLPHVLLLLLLVTCVIDFLRLSCFSVFLLLPCGHLLGKG